MERRVIIPAAGKGTRLMRPGDAVLPKVLREVNGRSLLSIVLSQTSFISPENTYIVVGYMKDMVISSFGDKYNYVEQREQLGTGHAVMMCADAFKEFDGTVLVTFGDMPLFRYDCMLSMCEEHERNHADCTLLTAYNPKLEFWARLIRDSNGKFKRIVEAKDCTPEEVQVKELFAGVLVFNSKSLFEMLPEMGNNNVQKEYYLTEVPELMLRHGMNVGTFLTDDGDDLRGVNTPEDLVVCEKILKERVEKHPELYNFA